jgi:hypothetical protein
MSFMDWGTVTTTAITGAVGIAGVAGSIVSARLAGKSAVENLKTSIAADDERARRAEMRRIYVAYVNGMNALTRALADLQESFGSPSREELRASVEKAYEELTLASSELWLVCSASVKDEAEYIGVTLWQLYKDFRSGELKPDAPNMRDGLRSNLIIAMRADLGEDTFGQALRSTVDGAVRERAPARAVADPLDLQRHPLRPSRAVSRPVQDTRRGLRHVWLDSGPPPLTRWPVGSAITP